MTIYEVTTQELENEEKFLTSFFTIQKARTFIGEYLFLRFGGMSYNRQGVLIDSKSKEEIFNPGQDDEAHYNNVIYRINEVEKDDY